MSIEKIVKDKDKKYDLYCNEINCNEIECKNDTLLYSSTALNCGITNIVGFNSTGVCSRVVKRSFIQGKKVREYSVQFDCVTTATTSTFSFDFEMETGYEVLFWKYNHIDIEASNNEYQGYSFAVVGNTVSMTIDINTTFASSPARVTFVLKTVEDA